MDFPVDFLYIIVLYKKCVHNFEKKSTDFFLNPQNAVFLHIGPFRRRPPFIYIYLINLLLGIFNLIPITPLDGGRIVYFFSSGKIKKIYDFIEKYGVVIIVMIAYFVNEYFSDKILLMFDFFLKLAGINLGL